MTLESRIADLITSLGTDYKTIKGWVGTLGSLTTTDKTSVVAAINEVNAKPSAPTATTSAAGISELSDDTEALAMSAADRVLTPHSIGAIVNVNNGLVKLDSGGKVAAAQLPSYVDDVIEAANFAALPGTGATGVMYVTLDTNKTYRWSGSAYVEISPSPGTTDSVTEGSTNLYFTNARADTRADGRITTRIGDETTDLVALYTTAKA